MSARVKRELFRIKKKEKKAYIPCAVECWLCAIVELGNGWKDAKRWAQMEMKRKFYEY